jgi:hypothetical protein
VDADRLGVEGGVGGFLVGEFLVEGGGGGGLFGGGGGLFGIDARGDLLRGFGHPGDWISGREGGSER